MAGSAEFKINTQSNKLVRYLPILGWLSREMIEQKYLVEMMWFYFQEVISSKAALPS